jgi:hypothetical protein
MAIITQSRNITDFQATSTSSFDTSAVNKTLTISTGKAFYVGQVITVAPVGAVLPTRLRGTVASYDAVTGVMVFTPLTPWVEQDVTSVTSLTIGTGSKTLTIAPNLGLVASDPITIQQISNNGQFMVGTVTSYNSTTGVLVANITVIGSSGTYTDWNVYSNATFSNWTITNQQADILEIRNGATLTISATPMTRPGTIQCITSGKLRVQNSSTTVPLILDLHDMNHDFRFAAGGVLEFKGAPMSLGTGTGAAKSWDFATLFGGVIRHMTYVEVEEAAGSGVYMPWPIIDEDPKFNLNVDTNTIIGGATPAAFSAGNTLAGRVLFWHETNRTLRCGDGTNGAAIPNGCAVRIPNIFVSNRLLTNQTTVLNMICSGSPTGGSFVLEISRENGKVLGTATIPFNATAAQVDTLIEAVTGVGTVTAGSGSLPNTAVNVTWTGAYAQERLAVRVVSHTLTGGTNPQASVYENNGANMSLINLNPLGTFDAEWVSFSHKIRCITDTFKSFRARNVGFGAAGLQLNNSNGTVDIDGLAILRSPFDNPGRSQINSVLGQVRARRVVSAGKTPAADFIFATTPNLQDVDRVYAYIYGTKNSANNRSLQFITVPSGIKITNIGGFGAPYSFQNTTDMKVVNIAYADTTLSTQQTTHGTSGILTSNCTNPTFANLFNGGPASARSYVISTDAASSGVKLLGVNVDAPNTAGLLMQCSGLDIRNMNMANSRGGPLIDLPTTYLANNLLIKKMFATFSLAQSANGLDACQGGQYDLVSSSPLGITETFAGVNDFVGGNYADASLTPTTGHVTFGPFGEGVGLELTGAAYTDALGAFLMPEAGDTATITMPFAMHAITGFQNSNPLLYVDAPGALANSHVLAAPGAPTGGTFTLSVYDASNTLIGTTAPIAFNANGTAVASALGALPSLAGNVSVTNSLTSGGSIIFTAALAGQAFIVTIDGSGLTGGTEPGVAYVYGRARLMNGNEKLGASITAEFAVRKPGTSWPAYQSLTGANLAAAIPALTGYQPGGSGLEMRIKLTTSVASAYTKFNQISLPTNIDPDGWFVGDATITFQGPAADEMVRIVRASDLTVLYSFTGSGAKEFAVGENFDVDVFFRRELPDGTVVMRTLPATQKLTFGDNGTVSLFYGSEVQLAQSPDVTAMKATIDAYLDVAISTRLATIAQTNIDAIQAKTDRLTFNAQNHVASNIHQVQAGVVVPSDVVQVNGILIDGVGTESNPWGPA